MYRMAIMAMTMAGSAEYNQQRLIKLAIVHDLAEAIVGDIAPSDNVSKEDKHEQEAAALVQITNMLGSESAAAQEVSALWCATAACPEAPSEWSIRADLRVVLIHVST